MGRGHQVNGKSLRQVLKNAGYNPDSDEELRAFCEESKTAELPLGGFSLTSLKRWLANGGIHEDSLHDLADFLGVENWEELSLGHTLPADAPPAPPASQQGQLSLVMTMTLHLFGDLSRLQNVDPVIVQSKFRVAVEKSVEGQLPLLVKDLLGGGSIRVEIEIYSYRTLVNVFAAFFKRRLQPLGVCRMDITTTYDITQPIAEALHLASKIPEGLLTDDIRHALASRQKTFIYGAVDSFVISRELATENYWRIQSSLWLSEIEDSLAAFPIPRSSHVENLDEPLDEHQPSNFADHSNDFDFADHPNDTMIDFHE